MGKKTQSKRDVERLQDKRDLQELKATIIKDPALETPTKEDPKDA